MAKMKYRVESKQTYDQKALGHIGSKEGVIKFVYVDKGGVPSTANGKALIVYGREKHQTANEPKKWVIDPQGEELLKRATGSGYTPQQRETLQESADNLNKLRPGFAKDEKAVTAAREANVPLFYTSDVSAENTKQGYIERTYHPEKSTFGVSMDATQASTFAEDTYKNTDKAFQSKMDANGIDVPPSEERVGLVSIYHQSPSVFSNPEVLKALKNNDREKLISVLEDPKNMPTDPVLRQRRLDDIKTIGRHDDPDVIRNDNNSQAGLDATFKIPAKTTPSSGPFQPQTPQYQPQQPEWELVGPSEDVQPTQPRPSILDSAGQVVGQIGGAISTVGRATFDMATSLGKETLNQLIQMALSGGANGKDVMKRAVQLAMGNMVANMQAQMLAALLGSPEQRNDLHRPVIFPEDHAPRRPVEDVMNNPQNQGLFDALAEQLMAMLGLGGGGDPSQVMVDALLKNFRDGTVKLPGDILLPDISGKKDGPFITIFGIPVGVGYPGVIIEENSQPRPGMDHLPFYRNGEGKVVVKAHNRSGHPVKEYTRSVPDGDETNNLSYRSKA